MKKAILYLVISAIFFSCYHTTKEEPKKVVQPKVETPKPDTLKKDIILVKKPEIDPKNIKPVFGYRFQIIGDFDGDSIQDTLREHFYSRRDKKETNKYYSGIDDFWVEIDSIKNKDCQSYMLCSNPMLDTIPVYGVFGPLFVKNEGNIDNDPGDEISFVPSLPQQSSMNRCHILSFKHGKWKEIYSFEIREWQIPPLPQAGKTYGLFGADGFYCADTNNPVNKKLEKQFQDFPGFIKSLGGGKIRIKTFNREVEEVYRVVDLTKHPKPIN